MRAAGDVIGDKGSALAHRLRTAGGCIHCSLELELSVYLSRLCPRRSMEVDNGIVQRTSRRSRVLLGRSCFGDAGNRPNAEPP